MTFKQDHIRSLEEALITDCLQSFSTTPATKEISGSFVFTADFPGFAGHFAGRPILPAIVQLAAVRILASRGLKKQLQLKTALKAKFKKVVIPGETIQLLVKYQQEAEQYQLIFRIFTESGTVASGELFCLAPS